MKLFVYSPEAERLAAAERASPAARGALSLRSESQRRPFFWHETTVCWLFHFANIFTGVTGCDRAGRNRQLGHPEDKQATRGRSQIYRLPGSDGVGLVASRGFISPHGTRPELIRGRRETLPPVSLIDVVSHTRPRHFTGACLLAV